MADASSADRPAAAAEPARGTRSGAAWRLGVAAMALALPALALRTSGPLAAGAAWLVGLGLLAASHPWRPRADPAAPGPDPRPADAADAAPGASAGPGGPGDADDAAGASAGAARPGCSRLVRQLVPVWQRNVEAARSHSEQATADLLQSFATLSSEMDQALSAAGGGLQMELGAADELTERHRAELDRLLADSHEAHRRMRAMRQGVVELREPLRALRETADEVRAIGRSAHMLALNTAAEAHRGGTSSDGVRVAATELAELARLAREASRAMFERLADVDSHLAAVGGRHAAADIDDDELALRAQTSARAVVVGMLGSLDEAGRASRMLQRTGQQLNTEISNIIVGLQSQDRFSQMLGSVTEDMQRLHAWLRGADDAAALTPAQWLARLEASYTMEEMRSSHHGTTSVDAGSSVEFF